MSYNLLIATILRLPFAGYRERNSGYYSYQSSTAFYWSSSPYTFRAYALYFAPSTIFPIYSDSRAYAFSIRCLKN